MHIHNAGHATLLRSLTCRCTYILSIYTIRMAFQLATFNSGMPHLKHWCRHPNSVHWWERTYFQTTYREGDWLASLDDAILLCLPITYWQQYLNVDYHLKFQLGGFTATDLHIKTSQPPGSFLSSSQSQTQTTTHNIQISQSKTTPIMVHYMFLTPVCFIPWEISWELQTI
jgi:hypothetical protein